MLKEVVFFIYSIDKCRIAFNSIGGDFVGVTSAPEAWLKNS